MKYMVLVFFFVSTFILSASHNQQEFRPCHVTITEKLIVAYCIQKFGSSIISTSISYNKETQSYSDAQCIKNSLDDGVSVDSQLKPQEKDVALLMCKIGQYVKTIS